MPLHQFGNGKVKKNNITVDETNPFSVDVESTRFFSLMQELVAENKKTNKLLELIYGEEI